MKKYSNLALIAIVVAIAIIMQTSGLWDDFVQLFKQEDGHTNWQYVANWSGGVLIILLSAASVLLLISRQQKDKANQELHAIKQDLEIRVQERTATLDESNHLLKQEVEQHKQTTQRLHVSENYLKNILESMPTMLVGLNDNGQVTHWNKKAEDYTGLKAEDVIDKDLWESYPIISVSKQQVEQAIRSNEALSFRQSQRGLFHFDVSIAPLSGTDDIGVVVLISDVTTQVKNANSLIERDRVSSMGELASSMAHDINQPLQNIFADIKQIKLRISELSSVARPEVAEKLQEIRKELADATNQGEKASAIVNNLLDFAQNHDNEKQLTNLADVMDHAIEIAEKTFTLPQGMQFSDITIERDYEQELPQVPCYVSEIQQVFLSILRHCFHAIGQANAENFKPQIRVRMVDCYDALWFKVSHNGKGLSAEQQQCIFEPFFGDDIGDEQYQSSQRLSFPHFIITEHHNGEMAVTSDEQVGTTFHMQLQLK